MVSNNEFIIVKRCVALCGASLAAEERGAAKPRGRGHGQRNIFLQIITDVFMLRHGT